MSDFAVDREMLETFSTSEIKRILREEYDDYTEEALEIFRDILEERAEDVRPPGSSGAVASVPPQIKTNSLAGSLPINNPRDAIDFLNGLLTGVLNESVNSERARVSVEIVSAILKAHEAALMIESDEE